jgi:putative protease
VINAVHGSTITPDKLSWIDNGTIIHRNHDHEFLTQLDKAKVERRIAVEQKLTESPDGLIIAATDEDGNKAEHKIVCEKVLAQKPEQALENIKKQLSKSGGTEFECVGTTVELSEAYFLPISMLNELRRAVLEDLAAVRKKNRPVQKGGVNKNDTPYPAEKLAFTGNVLNKKAEEFYRRHGVKSIEPAAETGLDLRGRVVMTTRYCLKHQLGACTKKGRSTYKEPLYLVTSEGHRIKLNFNCARCEMELIW